MDISTEQAIENGKAAYGRKENEASRILIGSENYKGHKIEIFKDFQGEFFTNIDGKTHPDSYFYSTKEKAVSVAKMNIDRGVIPKRVKE